MPARTAANASPGSLAKTQRSALAPHAHGLVSSPRSSARRMLWSARSKAGVEWAAAHESQEGQLAERIDTLLVLV